MQVLQSAAECGWWNKWLPEAIKFDCKVSKAQHVQLCQELDMQK